MKGRGGSLLLERQSELHRRETRPEAAGDSSNAAVSAAVAPIGAEETPRCSCFPWRCGSVTPEAPFGQTPGSSSSPPARLPALPALHRLRPVLYHREASSEPPGLRRSLWEHGEGATPGLTGTSSPGGLHGAHPAVVEAVQTPPPEDEAGGSRRLNTRAGACVLDVRCRSLALSFSTRCPKFLKEHSCMLVDTIWGRDHRLHCLRPPSSLPSSSRSAAGEVRLH
ncbi:uncharacterized protein [Salminus brasiliensis]|uniref:uncharacterized protein n=1 Tax=Salminus brasiliensis TaxID=930266 RepID=UPI003B82E2A3